MSQSRSANLKVELAKAPFDNPLADLILRPKKLNETEYPVHFRVSRSTLSVASPVLAGMIDLPSQGPPGEIQVVDLPETSAELDLCLRHIYPVRSPEVTELHQMRLLADFAHKYQVDVLEQDAKRYLTNAVNRDPLSVFAIAVMYKYTTIVEQAVRSCLNDDFSSLRSTYVRYIPVALYLDLLMYHVACGQAACAVSSSRGWFSKLLREDPKSTFLSKNSCTN
jgi:hypothetical protein